MYDWAFFRSEYKAQFEAWLDKPYPQKSQAKGAARMEAEAASKREEERQTEIEEEAHEGSDYSEDREVKQ